MPSTVPLPTLYDYLNRRTLTYDRATGYYYDHDGTAYDHRRPGWLYRAPDHDRPAPSDPEVS